MLDGFSPTVEAVLNCLVNELNHCGLCAISQFPFHLLKTLLFSPLSLKEASPGGTRCSLSHSSFDEPDWDREEQPIHLELLEDIKVDRTYWRVCAPYRATSQKPSYN